MPAINSLSSSRITWEPINPNESVSTHAPVNDGFDEDPGEGDEVGDVDGWDEAPPVRTLSADTLARGAEGARVMDLQRALASKGHYSGTVDGKFGAGTEDAVRRFQAASGLTADGKAGRLTQAALGLSVEGGSSGGNPTPVNAGSVVTGTQQRGSRGDGVRALQEALRAKGYYSGAADGSFGSGTEEAVRKFQAASGLTADGKAGRGTVKALGLRFIEGVSDIVDAPSGSNVVVARLHSYKNGGGLVHGTISVNGRSYAFTSGRGNLRSTPKGTFTITRHMNSRNDKRAFVRNGVGFSFRVQDGTAGFDTSHDPRDPRGYRKAIRIHPDGGVAGTAGCIGLTGSAAELKQFRSDMNALLSRNGGSVKLKVI